MDIHLNTPSIDNINTEKFGLMMTSGAFARLVMAASCRIIDMCSPVSKNCIQPIDNFNSSMDDAAAVYDYMAGFYHEPSGFRPTNSQIHYLSIHALLDLVIEYVSFRNQHSKDMWLVGEEHYHRQYAYAAVCSFQHWKCKSLDQKIETMGTEFGSATGWHTHSYLPFIADWPTKFGVHDVPFSVPEIPCLRPDWEKRRIGWRIKNIEKLLSSDIRPTVVKLKYVDEKYSHAIGANIDLYVRDWGSEPNTVYVTAVHPSKFNAELDSVYPADYDSISSINGSYV